MDRASFKVYSKELTIEEITGYLKAAPAKGLRKGDPVSKRNPSGSVHEENVWIWEPNSTIFENQLSEISNFIREHENILSKSLAACSFDLVCTISVEGSQRSLSILAAEILPVVQIGADILLTAIDVEEEIDPLNNVATSIT